MPRTASFASQDLVRELLAQAAGMERRMFNAFLRQVKSVSNDPDLLRLLGDVQAGMYQALTPGLEARIAQIQIPTQELSLISQQAFAASARTTATALQFETSFNLINPAAVDIARRLPLDMVQSITSATKSQLRFVISEAVDGALPPSRVRRLLLQRIGLTPRYSMALSNYENSLVAMGLPQGRITRDVARYANRLLRARAENIARTEIARATSWGQQEVWQQMNDTGFIPPNAMRVWITTDDEKTCEICGPMNGVTTSILGTWKTDNGLVRVPTDVHPQCRCTSGLVFPDKVGKNDPLGYERWALERTA